MAKLYGTWLFVSITPIAFASTLPLPAFGKSRFYEACPSAPLAQQALSCYGGFTQSFSPEIAARIQQKVDAHLYPSPDDVMRHALDALDDWQEHERREVLKGLKQAEQGNIAVLDMAGIIREAREQWDEQHP